MDLMDIMDSMTPYIWGCVDAFHTYIDNGQGGQIELVYRTEQPRLPGDQLLQG